MWVDGFTRFHSVCRVGSLALVDKRPNAPFVPRERPDVLREIERLDPETGNERVAYLSAAYDFAWDTQRAYELALLRTFAVPKTSKLLVRTREFTERTQKRYDDTVIIMSTIGLCGYSSPEGRAAIRRMNQIHARYRIPNEEFLYVLSTFMLETVRWNAKYGWRPLSDNELQASYVFWREVGRRMNIRDIPGSFAEVEAFSLAHEREHFAHSADTQLLAEVTRDLFLSWVLPKPLWPLGAELVYAVLSDELLGPFGFPRPKLWARALVEGGLWLRKKVLRRLPPRRRPYRLPPTRTYGEMPEMSTVGPQPAPEGARAERETSNST